MQLRLFFPLFSNSQIISATSKATKVELAKLKTFAHEKLIPNLTAKHYYKYPYHIQITFYCHTDFDAVSMLIWASYIIKELGIYCLQSTDYRVIPKITISSKHTLKKSTEGCEIVIEKLIKD